MVEVAKPGPGSWAGVAPAPRGTHEGPRNERGASCPEQGFLGTNLGSPRHPYALGCSSAPQALPSTIGSSPVLQTLATPRVLPCTSGSPYAQGYPQHSSSSHGRISLAPISCPQSEHPGYPHTLHFSSLKVDPHLEVSQHPHHAGDSGSTTQCRGAGRWGTSPFTNPCPRLSPR